MLPTISADLAFILYATTVLLNKVLWWLVTGITVAGVPPVTDVNGIAYVAVNMTKSLLTIVDKVLEFSVSPTFNLPATLADLTKDLINFLAKLLAELAAFV